MNKELSSFAARLRERFFVGDDVRSLYANARKLGPPHVGSYKDFDTLALELFRLQFEHNAAYRKICEVRKRPPQTVEHWTQIPAVPAVAFKELELSCIPPEERTAVFHSSGTTEQEPSRHFHNPESLGVYETALWSWFAQNVLSDLRFTNYDLRSDGQSIIGSRQSVIFLTPPPSQAPHSSLVHMFETIRSRACESADCSFYGMVATDGSWILDFDAVTDAFSSRGVCTRSSRGNEAQISAANHEVRVSSCRLLPSQGETMPVLLLGTAFSFVHLLDVLAERNLRFDLPAGSRVMETGGYKNRSRSMPKAELHALITDRLGVPPTNIVCEYGMSELSSQAYDGVASGEWRVARDGNSRHASPVTRHFHFPPWSRVQIISPETGYEVADGETGMIRVFDLANVFSVMAVQTEDLGVRQGDGFELIGRDLMAESRGCSLMSA